MEEIWKDIKGYEDKYRISNLGRVMSLKNKFGNRELILRQYTSNGYCHFTMCKDSKLKMSRTHQIVAQTFIENPDNKPYVNHIDGDKRNNFVENLEWCTAKENVIHAYKLGLTSMNKGEDHYLAKLTERDVLEIKKYKGSKIKYKDISKIYGVNKNTIGSIIKGKTWKHLS